MTLLVHLRILAVRRLRITADVVTTTETDVCIVGCYVLCHAFRKAGTMCTVLRSSRCAGRSRLIPNGWQLRVRGLLAWHTYSLSHLSIDRRLRRTTVVRNTLLLLLLLMLLLHLSAMTLIVGLARGFLFLLLGLPFFADLLKLY